MCFMFVKSSKNLLILFNKWTREPWLTIYVKRLLLSSSVCYIIAEGFRCMLLGLVRLRAFRLGAWVGWVQHWGGSWRGHARADGGVSQMSQYSETKRVTECEWRRVEVCGDLREVRELSTRCQTRRIDFWSSQTRD